MMSPALDLSGKPFGYQLLLDLYRCRPGTCNDIALCYRFLDEIVDHIGMQKISSPHVFFTDPVKWPDKAGLSGWVPLIESSVVLHTITLKNFVSIDVYSCREFDPKMVLDFARPLFFPENHESQFLYRGKDYMDI